VSLSQKDPSHLLVSADLLSQATDTLSALLSERYDPDWTSDCCYCGRLSKPEFMVGLYQPGNYQRACPGCVLELYFGGKKVEPALNECWSAKTRLRQDWRKAKKLEPAEILIDERTYPLKETEQLLIELNGRYCLQNFEDLEYEYLILQTHFLLNSALRQGLKSMKDAKRDVEGYLKNLDQYTEAREGLKKP